MFLVQYHLMASQLPYSSPILPVFTQSACYIFILATDTASNICCATWYCFYSYLSPLSLYIGMYTDLISKSNCSAPFRAMLKSLDDVWYSHQLTILLYISWHHQAMSSILYFFFHLYIKVVQLFTPKTFRGLVSCYVSHTPGL